MGSGSSASQVHSSTTDFTKKGCIWVNVDSEELSRAYDLAFSVMEDSTVLCEGCGVQLPTRNDVTGHWHVGQLNENLLLAHEQRAKRK